MLRYFVIAIVIAFILYMCFKIFTSGADIQSSIDEKRKELEKQGLRCSVFLRHLAGTDLPVGAFCMIRCFPENVEVSSSNLRRIIEKNDIVDAFMTTSTELLKEENKDKYGELSDYVQNKYVSRNPHREHTYLVLERKVDGAIKYCGFDVIANRKTDKIEDVHKLIEQCKTIEEAKVEEA